MGGPGWGGAHQGGGGPRGETSGPRGQAPEGRRDRREGGPAVCQAVGPGAGTLDRQAGVVRPFSIYGPGGQPHKLVPTLLRCAERGEVFPMLADVSRRDLVHVGDVADGCVRAAARRSA